MPDVDIDRLVRLSLDRMRKKLLDLTARNPLLSFKHSARSRRFVRLIDELPDELHNRLQSGSALRFRALPDAPDEPEDERTILFRRTLEQAKAEDPEYRESLRELGDDPSDRSLRRLDNEIRARVRERLGMPPRPAGAGMTPSDAARGHGLDPSFDLPRANGQVAPKHTDNIIQTLLFEDQLDRLLTWLRDQVRLGLEESGVNTLFCAFGFLEWYESSDSNTAHYAPLLLYPLEMQRDLIRGQYRYSVTSIGDDAATNITLAERLKRDFKIELPAFEEDDTPETYFEKIAEIAAGHGGWRVRRWVTIGLFSFARIAMYHDLDSDRWPEGALTSHGSLRRLLTGTEQPPAEGVYAEDRELDTSSDPEPLLIADADTSQVSAITDALDDRDMVIEGPPGTGKSQTITNLIAAAVAQGKTVLFVAEKMAALHVVKSRLDDAGLGSFCLELHSSKARRRDVVESLARRLGLGQQHDATPRLTAAIAETKRLREQLRAYVVALNAPVGAIEMSVQEVLWACQRLRDEYPQLPAALDGLTIPDVECVNRVQLANSEQLLYAVQRQRASIVSECGSVRRHQWYGVANPDLDPFAVGDLVRAVAALAVAARDVAAHSETAACLFCPDSRWHVGYIRVFGATTSTLCERVLEADLDLVSRLTDAGAVRTSRRFVHDVRRLAKLREQLQAAFESPTHASSVESLRLIAKLAEETGLSDATVGAVQAIVQERRSEAEDWGVLLAYAQRLASVLRCESTLTMQTVRILCRAAHATVTAPPPVLTLRAPGLVEWGALEAIAASFDRWKRLNEQQQELSRRFRLNVRIDPDQLESHAIELQRPGVLRWVRSRYRAARREYRALECKKQRVSRARMAQDLQELAAHKRAVEGFASDSDLMERLGHRFGGLETDFTPILATARWAADVCEECAGADADVGAIVRRTLFTCSAEEFSGLRALAGRPQLPLLDAAVNGDGDVGSMDARATKLQLCAAQSEELLKLLGVMGLRAQVRLEECEALALVAEEAGAVEARLADGGPAARLLVDVRQHEGRLAAIEAAADFAQGIHDADLPDGARSWLLALEQPQRTEALRAAGRDIVQALRRLDEALGQIGTIAPICLRDWIGFDSVDEAFPADLQQHMERCASTQTALEELVSDRRAERDARDAGLGPVLDAVEGVSPTLADLGVAYRRVLYQSLARAAVVKAPELARFSGVPHEAARKRYRELDRELLRLHSTNLACVLARRGVDPGIGSGARSTWTGRALILNEVSKSKRHIPIRDLFDRAGAAIQQMMPCFMMSPLSIAQHLAANGLCFDLVVMDEASQIRPEEAVGAIVRARQVVVVGDPKQLPPTPFFHQADTPVDEDEEPDVADEESILDISMAVLRPVRRLKWHYRSRHGSLIAYSNKEFYNQDLIVFPSPYHKHEDFGVRYVHVPDGCYRAGLNPPEVRHVAAAAIEFMRRHPERSLGIVTMNRAQQEALSLELDRLLAENPDAEAYRARWEPTLEPLFVKNLENVQGDERDAIFISTVYGRGEKGEFHRRFGPINNAGGHRRLNVLFTRAKYQTVVFSSMDPDEIVLDESSSWGQRCLKGFLGYARSGILDLSVPSTREPDSDFEICVARGLREQGFDVVPQVGVAGYFVDIGVRHPSRPGSFICGIECDGAMYHSAKSTRDRDRLRQEVLERLGWNVQRIWSLDWYRNPGKELSRVVQALHQLAAAQRQP